MALQRDHIIPGPIDDSVLTLQREHRSEAVWFGIDGAPTATLDCRRCRATRADDLNNMPARVVQLLRLSGFYGLARVGFFQLDHHLITMLVEHWRPETDTFHLPDRECTITLQVVAIQTGLQIDGEPIIGPTSCRWPEMCQQLLGRTLPDRAIRGSVVRLGWLVEEFPILPPDANEQDILFYTRAYILRLLTEYIFCSKDTGRVSLLLLPYLTDLEQIGQYSWGSVCLAFLFRELCLACQYLLVSQIAGPLFLLQVWAWDRFPFLAPTIADIDVPYDAPLAGRWHQSRNTTQVLNHVLVQIRRALDTARQDNIIWEPYDSWILRNLPPYCLHGCHIWTALVPLIYIHIVE